MRPAELRKDKAIQSIDRIGAMYAQREAEREEKAYKFKVNLGKILVAVAILGILIQIL